MIYTVVSDHDSFRPTDCKVIFVWAEEGTKIGDIVIPKTNRGMYSDAYQPLFVVVQYAADTIGWYDPILIGLYQEAEINDMIERLGEVPETLWWKFGRQASAATAWLRAFLHPESILLHASAWEQNVPLNSWPEGLPPVKGTFKLVVVA